MKRSNSKPSTPAEKRPGNGGKATPRRESRKEPEGFFEPLDQQERDIQEALEKGTLKLLPDQEGWREALREAARRTLAKNKHISIRLAEADLEALKARAAALGMPYQTLIGSLLHQYVEGKIRAAF
jgi:predicted DNA binding CopG/RHH family protein